MSKSRRKHGSDNDGERWVRMILKSRLVVWAFLIVIVGAVACAVVILISPRSMKLSLPNNGFEEVAYYGDKFSDANGNRAFPWGFEIWLGNPTFLFDDTVSRTGRYSARITGHALDDAAVVAIPGLLHKPSVSEGKEYVLTAWIKMLDVGGHGVRLVQQFLDGTGAIIKTDYSSSHQGTSNWRIIKFATVAPPGAVIGDPIVELWGTGTVWIDDVELFSY